MTAKTLYAVVEFNQPSGEPDDQTVTFFYDLDGAREFALDLRGEAKSTGTRETYRVFELVEVKS